MTDAIRTNLRSALARLLAAPTAVDLWHLQADLLALGGDAALSAREVARVFHSCLRDLESKLASRRASRMGAALATAAVTSVGLGEILAGQSAPLRRLLASGVAALLETGGAIKSAQAWEVEASLVYYDLAWYLYGELWDISLVTRPELTVEERQSLSTQLLEPLTDPGVNDAMKSVLLVRLFQIVLASRLWPLLT